MAQDLTRRSRFAGSFYPGSSGEIAEMLDIFKEQAGEEVIVTGPPILMLPHAGWVYSGLAAVKGLLTLAGSPPKRVILIGPAHRHPVPGFSIAGYREYKTPLGSLEVDLALQEEICDHTGFSFVREAHEAEHSVEVILPMLQYLLEGEKKILPILAGGVLRADTDKMADALAALLDPGSDVLIISSDLSHFYSYDEARSLDRETLEFILDGNSEAILERSGEGGRLACGYAGIVVGMGLARRWNLGKPELLIYYNSGDSGGDRGSVVGYAALAYKAPDLSVM